MTGQRLTEYSTAHYSNILGKLLLVLAELYSEDSYYEITHFSSTRAFHFRYGCYGLELNKVPLSLREFSQAT